jgi:hypothetical protein
VKYQVVCTDGRDNILEYKDFGEREIGPMLKYINKKAIDTKCVVIKVRKWADE